MTAAARLEEVLALERRGDLLLAYDTACRALVEEPDDLRLRYRSVLLLARAGSPGQARQRFLDLHLDEVDDPDVGALAARIEKDAALALPEAERPAAARRAAEHYLAVAGATGDAYPLVNAATLLLLAGDRPAAAELAADLLTRADEGDYWSAATKAEAALVLGDTAAASSALAVASERADGDWAAVATTRRQLLLLCGVRGLPERVLDSLVSPLVAHYCGHRAGGTGIAAADEPAVEARIAQVLDDDPVHVAHGSLASGADLLWAEALVRRGAELHVVLPFDRDSFLASSVAPSGPAWVARFDAVLQQAASVTYVTEQTQEPDDALYAAAADEAMGSALLRARVLGARAVQLAVWDGLPARGAAGTAHDVARWRSTGRPGVVVPSAAPAVVPGASAPPASRRTLRCLLFTDVAGYSRMSDDELLVFQDATGAAWSAALAPFRDQLLTVDTWGDAVFAVLPDVVSGAACAVALRDAFHALDAAALGLPSLGLRVAAHVGPVFERYDEVAGRPGWAGVHVNRTARIEPVTPPGEIYVTEAFAAALELAGVEGMHCQYVGHLPTAKDYGLLRMHRLHALPTRRTSPAPPG